MEGDMAGKRCAGMFVWLMLAGVLLACGCAKKQVTSGPISPRPVPPVVQEEKQSPDKAPAETYTVSALIKRGKQLAGVGNYRAALDVYGTALTLASGHEMVQVLDLVEQVLFKCDVPLLQELMGVTDHNIPPSMLLYSLGYRYAARGDKDRSREILQSYLQQYPRGRRAEDARQLMEILSVKKESGVKIGCLLPLSGKYAVFGQRALKGAQVALARLIPRYGDRIVLLVRDTESDEQVARLRMQELISAQVMAIVGPMVTAVNVVDLAQTHGIPMIAMTQKEALSRRGGYVFTNFITPAMQVDSLVSHAMMHLGVRRFAVLHPRDKYGMALMQLFCQRVTEMGGTVQKVVAYDGGQTDFSREIKRVAGFDDPRLQTALRRAKSQDTQSSAAGGKSEAIVNFDAIFIPDGPSRLALILPQLIYNDVTGTHLLGTNIWHQTSLIQQAGDYVRNAVITDGYFADSSRPEARRFKEQFMAMFDTSPQFIEAIAHDTLSILVETVMDPAVTSPETLKDALTGTRIFEGATGKTLFDRDGKLHKELFFLTVKNRAFVEITP